MSKPANDIVALVGSPNSGKTTLYNWLTGSNYKTVNYPGATVDYLIGQAHPSMGIKKQFVDTPGVYSLFPKSHDEVVTHNVLFQGLKLPSESADRHDTNASENKVTSIIAVVDGTQLQRHLVLVEQLKETKLPIVVVVTMSDLLNIVGSSIDVKKLSAKLAVPVVLFNGMNGEGLSELSPILNSSDFLKNEQGHHQTSGTRSEFIKLSPWSVEKTKFVQDQISSMVSECLMQPKNIERIFEKSWKLDAWLMHPILGVLIFVLIMGGLFSSVFWLAAPLMDLVDSGLSQVGEILKNNVQNNLLASFIGDGVVASLSSVLVFVPQIFILFFGIGILEGSGYLARAATLIDRPFLKLGLSGRSFVPFLSGFACAVPAIMATRNISSRREKLLATMVIPLLMCSARLPVFGLLLAFFFVGEASWKPGLSLAIIYLFSLVVGSVASLILHRLIPEDKKSKGFFMMELPLYRKPKLKVLFSQALSKTKSYIKSAGTVIFGLALLVWVGTTFPKYNLENKTQRLEQSYLGQAGQMVEPIFKPMGLDWRVGLGLMTAFAAREVFVSTLAVVFNTSAEDNSADQDSNEENAGLLLAMKNAKRSDGQIMFTGATVLGLILFFVIALQCLSTFAIVVKELGSWKLAVFQLITMNLVAYGLSVLVVTVLS